MFNIIRNDRVCIIVGSEYKDHRKDASKIYITVYRIIGKGQSGLCRDFYMEDYYRHLFSNRDRLEPIFRIY